MQSKDPRNLNPNDPFQKTKQRGGRITSESPVSGDSISGKKLLFFSFLLLLPFIILSVYLFSIGLKLLSSFLIGIIVFLIIIGLVFKFLDSRFS